VFFDHDVPDGIASWPCTERVRCTVCDESYWRRLTGKRPDDVLLRQAANFRYVFGLTRAEWLLTDDLDERIFAREDIGQLLARLGDDVFSVTAPSLEAIYEFEPTIEIAFWTRWFKVQQKNGANADLIDEMFGDLAPLSRNGLFGHVSGKSFVRTRYAAADFDCHGATPVDASLQTKVMIPGLELLHFDALTFVDWKDKWISRIVENQRPGMEKRRLQFERIRSAYERQDESALFHLYRTMCILDPAALQRAIEAGMVEPRIIGTPGPRSFIERPAAGRSSNYFGAEH